MTAEPLTTELAADFARRWDWWRRHELECAPLDLVAMEKWLRDNGPAERVLPEPDRERLFAWVRWEVAQRLAGSPSNDPQAVASEHINDLLELSDDDDDAAWDLCAQAGACAWSPGWPS